MEFNFIGRKLKIAWKSVISNTWSDEKKISKRIDDEILLSGSKEYLEQRILLLGTGDSGKTTVRRQLEMLNMEGLSRMAKLNAKNDVIDMLLDTMRLIVQLVTLMNPEIEQLVEISECIEQASKTKTSVINQQLLTLWKDNSSLNAWIVEKLKSGYLLSSDQHQLFDSSPYLLRHMPQILEEDYLPTSNDILRIRKPTKRVVDIQYTKVVAGNTMNFRLIDAGGQRLQRLKWANYYENVHVVLFVSSISEYNQVLLEDPTTNRMIESLNVFRKIVNHSLFTNSIFILFLNKYDIFKEKIKFHNITNVFQDYNGEQECTPASEHILSIFKSLIRSRQFVERSKKPLNIAQKRLADANTGEDTDEPRVIYPHFTSATATFQIKTIFDTIYDEIIKERLACLRMV